jgi:hypothetical protein
MFDCHMEAAGSLESALDERLQDRSATPLLARRAVRHESASRPVTSIEFPLAPAAPASVF